MDSISIVTIQYVSGTVNEGSCDVVAFTCTR